MYNESNDKNIYKGEEGIERSKVWENIEDEKRKLFLVISSIFIDKPTQSDDCNYNDKP